MIPYCKLPKWLVPNRSKKKQGEKYSCAVPNAQWDWNITLHLFDFYGKLQGK